MQNSQQQQNNNIQLKIEAKAQSEYYQPTTQAYQYKIFINECNGYIGSQLVEIFRNDDQIQVNANIICGTIDPNAKTIGQPAVNSIIQKDNKRLLNSVLKQSDIILYTLNKNNIRQFQELLKFIRKTKHEGQNPKRLICISSLITWNGRRGNLQQKVSLQNIHSRNSSQTNFMQLQNMCLNINNNPSNKIQTYVVCAGLVYGYGQGQLFSYFKQALQQSDSLKIYGSGSNYIPMIHLQDLCSIVKDIAFNGQVGQQKRQKGSLSQIRYYFGADKCKITQSQLIKCIASNLGNGKTDQIPIQDTFFQQNFDHMTLDCQISDIPALKQWHCQEGIAKNIQKIVSQFNLYRGLKPNKILIVGPPAAGKSKVAQILQKAYGLPVLTAKKVLDQLGNQQTQFAKQIKSKLQEIRSIKVQEQRKIFQQAKKKKKGKKDANDQFDPSKIIPRLPEDLLIKVFKYRLQKSDCLNKGYILDGWPKTAKSAQALFKNNTNQVDETLLPNSVFNIIGNEQQVKQRIKSLPQNIKQSTHWNQQATTRRFQIHTKGHNDQGAPVGFLTGKVDINDVAFNYTGSDQFINFVERNGPLGFKKKQKKIKQQKIEENKQSQSPQKAKVQGQQNENQQNQQQQQNEQNNQEQAEFDLQKLTQHEKQILNEKSRPIRQYLIDNVIPQITQGLLQICKQTPRDPISFLIKFLQNKQGIKKKNKTH